MIILIMILGLLGMMGYYFFNENVNLPQKIKHVEDLVKEKKLDAALEAINALPSSKRESLEIHYLSYQILMEQTQYVAALFHLTEILRRNLYNEQLTETQIHLDIAEIYETMKKPKKAIEEYESILTLDPKHELANQRLGENLFAMKNYGAALGFLEAAYEVDDSNPTTIKYLAEIYLIDQAYEKSLVMINQAITLGESTPELLLSKCRCLHALNRSVDVLKTAEAIINEPTVGALASLYKAIALSHLNRPGEARDIYASVLQKFNEDYQPIVLETRYDYAKILAGEGKVKEALRHLYLIRNSGETYLDVIHRIEIFTNLITNNHLLAILESSHVDNALRDALTRGISQENYIILKMEAPEPRTNYALIKKNATGSKLKFWVAIDLNLKESSEKFVTDFLHLVSSEELCSGIFFSLYGISPASQSRLETSKAEVVVYQIRDFENLLKGEKNIS